MAEQRLTGTGLLTPTPAGARTAESLDTVTVLRDDRQRVSGSRRLSGDDGSGARVTAYVRELLAGAERAWGSVPGAPLQSAVARVRETRRETRSGDHGDGAWATATVLARLETVAGPVLIGAGTVGRGLTGSPPAARPPLPPLPSTDLAPEPPAHWRRRPLLLGPAVAAQLVTAAWLAFTSGGSRERLAKLAGRRVLPGLDLLDTAGDQPPDGSDDGGHPAGALAVVSGGVLRALPRDPDTGLLAGRMVWDHDTRGCAARFPASLRLTGPEVPLPADALELTVCVEGLQRYHADGVLRLACPARTADEPDRWFMLQLRGRPLRLLQAARGLTGPPAAVHTDHTVTTAALVLPGAAALTEKGTGSLDHI
ncbi:hypothetical protein ACIBCB_34545 [Streptomyces uncialis]|uniref:hypothetical protein n=1 Tax=Streptomyces uncialis TaxID=1048205 RepID=UPI0037ADED0E